MEKPVVMPKLGMTMTEGTILNWLYQEGDMVEKGEPLVEVMTDKVNLEVEAPFAGRLASILAHEGDVLPIGEPIALLTSDSPSALSTPPAEPQAIKASGNAAPLLQGPNAAAAASSAQPHEWQALTASGNAAAAASSAQPYEWQAIKQPLESRERVASTPAAKREAALYNIDLQDVVRAGATEPLRREDILAYRGLKEKEGAPGEKAGGAQEQKIRATPLAQRIAREHQVDLAALSATRAGAKLTRSDVEAHLSNDHMSQRIAPPAENLTPVETPANDGEHDYELLPLSPVRRIIGQRMQQSITTAPHIYLDTEIDMTEAERCRQHFGQRLRGSDQPVPSMTAILLRASAATLVLHPATNAAFIQGQGTTKDAIKRWHVVNIGVAVDTEQALLTPVIRNAHRLSLLELAQELRRVTQQARAGTLQPDDLAGATFTISNLGMYGIDTFHAIIPPGQGAVLAVGKISKRGVVIEDEQGERLAIRPLMKVSLSADHRVLDGASGSRFLQQFKAFLEDPYLLL